MHPILTRKDAESCSFWRNHLESCHALARPQHHLSLPSCSFPSKAGRGLTCFTEVRLNVLYLPLKKTAVKVCICLFGKCHWRFLPGELVLTLHQSLKRLCFPYDQTPYFNSCLLPSVPLNLLLSFHYTFSFHILSF